MNRWTLLSFLVSTGAWAQTINTIAGDSTWRFPLDVVADAAGNIYTSDNTRAVIYRTDRFGATTIVAGDGTRGSAGDGQLATQAQLAQPIGLALGADGSLYIADSTANRIRRVAPNGRISTVAGTGRGGFAGDGGPATDALISFPQDLAIDAAGNLYFTDVYNNRIRRIAPNGIIATIAGNGSSSLAGDGGPPLLAGMNPGWLTVAADGSIYFSDDGDTTPAGNKRIRRIRNNVVSTVAGNGRGYGGDGGLASGAGFDSTDGVAVDGAGNIYVAEYWGDRVRRIAPDGVIMTYAGGRRGADGDGGPAARAGVHAPAGLALDAAGNLLLVDSYNARIRRVSEIRPVIGETNAVVPSFQGRTAFSSNTYVEIYGTNLSTTTRTWGGADFRGTNAPTSLDGVSVNVNGKPAFVYFVSPTQININTPEDTATGPVNIMVTNALGVSNIGVATRSRLSPALQSIPQFNVGGRPFVVAQTTDFRSFIGRPGMVTGVNFTPAKVGDSIILYALGCGPTTPATAAGTVAGQNAPLALAHEIRIAGRTARVTFGGAVAGTIGLYQFNVVIPEVGPGDHPIELVVDGVTNAQNLLIAIQ